MGKAFTQEEAKELGELLKKYSGAIWKVAVGKCGGHEEPATELYSKTLAKIAEREPNWADWWVAKAEGHTFMFFARGVAMRLLSTDMKRAAKDPQVHFAGNMTADNYASDERYSSPEQVAADRDMFDKTREQLVKAGHELAVKCLDLWAEGVTDYNEMAAKLGVDVKRVYKAAEQMKAAALAVEEGGKR